MAQSYFVNNELDHFAVVEVVHDIHKRQHLMLKYFIHLLSYSLKFVAPFTYLVNAPP